ncbi:hypothetical protein [Rhodococcus wratislaviensis]|nr:hypothetical protein [Rhodococcus wratislaviensis]
MGSTIGFVGLATAASPIAINLAKAGYHVCRIDVITYQVTTPAEFQ